jgi:hypothetical protein
MRPNSRNLIIFPYYLYLATGATFQKKKIELRCRYDTYCIFWGARRKNGFFFLVRLVHATPQLLKSSLEVGSGCQIRIIEAT